MLLVKYTKLDLSTFIEKYTNNIKVFTITEKSSGDKLIELIEQIKQAQLTNELILIDYAKELILSFNALKIPYILVYPMNISNEEYLANREECDTFKAIVNDDNSIVLEDIRQLELYLADKYNWIQLDLPEVVDKENSTEADLVKVEDKKRDLTLAELIDDNTVITEADVRELKSLTNKFKVAMLLQAKSRLNTVLSLCGTLDKLYAELVKRIDTSITTTDTSSLMYTADYISKALSDTNQFIMSLITSEKLQNFFIIDNSNVIISDDRVDIDKREKIRKAAEIVMDNIDYFAEGQYNNLKNPNIEISGELSEVIENVDTTPKSV